MTRNIARTPRRRRGATEPVAAGGAPGRLPCTGRRRVSHGARVPRRWHTDNATPISQWIEAIVVRSWRRRAREVVSAETVSRRAAGILIGGGGTDFPQHELPPCLLPADADCAPGAFCQPLNVLRYRRSGQKQSVKVGMHR